MKWVNKVIGKNKKMELADDLFKLTQQELEDLTPVNIIVVGKTGSGKSTMINAIFREKIAETGVGMPVTKYIQKISKKGIPLTLYDTRGLELDREVQKQVLEQLIQLIQQQALKGEKEKIDLVYYCLNANTHRIETNEIELIQRIAELVPVIIVLTQAIGQEHHEFIEYLNRLDIPIKGVIPILAKPYLLQDKHYIPAFGLDDLINQSLLVIPKDVHQAFINAQQVDIQKKEESARRWAKRYISTAFGIGFIPIPMADAALLVPMQIGMLAHISAIFGISLDKAQLVSILAGVGGTGSTTFLGKSAVKSLTKLVPGVGTVGGGVISGSTASVLTVALAYSYIEVLKRIALAEIEQRDITLVEIQNIMNKTLKEQLEIFDKVVPDSVRDNIIPKWLEYFINK